MFLYQVINVVICQGNKPKERSKSVALGDLSLPHDSPENSSLGSGSMGDTNDGLKHSQYTTYIILISLSYIDCLCMYLTIIVCTVHKLTVIPWNVT